MLLFIYYDKMGVVKQQKEGVNHPETERVLVLFAGVSDLFFLPVCWG